MTDLFFRCAAGGIVGIILILTVRGRNSEIALLVSLTCCCMIALSAIMIIAPIRQFVDKLQGIIAIEQGWVQILLKIVGIGLVNELAVAICADSGNSAIGKMLQLLSTVIILYLSLPLYSALLELVEKIVGGI